MAQSPLVASDIKKLQDESKAHFHLCACIWQCKVGPRLLAKENMVSVSMTGSRKTMTFWLPMLYEEGITFIVTPLKSLGSQLSEESIQKAFHQCQSQQNYLVKGPGSSKHEN